MKKRKIWLVSLLLILAAILCMTTLSACKEKKPTGETTGEQTNGTTGGQPEGTTGGQIEGTTGGQTGDPSGKPTGEHTHDWNAATCTAPKTCKVCEATEGDALGHAYNQEKVSDDTLKSAATCTAAAVYYKTCERCGAVSTDDADTFPYGERAEHHFVNGVCDACGHVGCDHKTLHEKTMDLYELGLCPSVLYYETCDCGTVVLISPESVLGRSQCNFVYSVDEETETGVRMVGSCKKCGLEVALEGEWTQTGCTESYHDTITLRKGDDVLFDCATWDETGVYHQQGVRAEIQLDGTCGGTLVVEKCKDCGEILEKMVLKPACSLNFEKDAVPTMRTDEDGTIHIIKTASCPVCGLTQETDRWTEGTGCTGVNYERLEIACGETVFLSILESNEFYSHNYQYTYTALGEDCEADGCRIDVVCNDCGERFYGYQNSHNDQYDEIKLADHGGCETVFFVYRCLACGEIEYFNPNDATVACDIVPSSETKDVDGVEHTVSTMTCSKCELRFVTETWQTQSTCSVTKYTLYSLYYGDELLMTYQESEDGPDNHDWDDVNVVYEKDDPDVSCDHGTYTITYTCKTCGAKRSIDYNWGHSWVDLEVDFSEQGGCEGTATGRKCRFCGEVKIDHWDIPCLSNDTVVWDEEETVSTDADGFEHTVFVGVCSECGLKFVLDEWAEKESDCIYRYCEILTVYRDDTKLFENRMNGDWENHHDMDVIYDLIGDNCDEGYYKTETCKICGFSLIDTGWGHQEEMVTIDAGEKGFCDGSFQRTVCRICGYENSLSARVSLDCHFDQDPEDATLYVCSVCGGKERITVTEKKEDCRLKTTTVTVYLTPAGEECFRVEVTYSRDSHDFETSYELHGTSCAEGYTVTKTCKDCGKTESGESSGHYSDRIIEYVLKNAEGICEAHKNEVNINRCPCGKDCSLSWGNDSTLEEQTGTDGNILTLSCDECGLKITMARTAETTGCRKIQTLSFRMTVGEETLYSEDFSAQYRAHDFANPQRIETEEGVTLRLTCTKCGGLSEMDIRIGTKIDDGRYQVSFVPKTNALYRFDALNYQVFSIFVLNDDGMKELAYGYDFVDIKLEAGKTYICQFDCTDESKIENKILCIYAPSIGNCDHDTQVIGVLLPGAKTCEDGSLYVRYDTDCKSFQIVEVRTDHMNYGHYVDLQKYGVCEGATYYYELCACGEGFRDRLTLDPEHCEVTSNTTDSELFGGCKKQVFACSKCGLYYEAYYTEVKDEESGINESTYLKVILKIGDTVLLDWAKEE